MSTGTGSMNGIARTGTSGVASLLLRGVVHWYFGENNNNAHDSNNDINYNDNSQHQHQRQLLEEERYLGDVNVYEDYDYSEARVGKYDYSNFNDIE
mmetsp:Transcript_25161/g.29078  ORF Transcript_25161/g.29078 Transcript_25161/m.29078 type:complete len:96 (+) Transcript_25161:129-416(+)